MVYSKVALSGSLGTALYLEVDESATDFSWKGFNVVGQSNIEPTVTMFGSFVLAKMVHVMSRPAGGEIRGYALVDGVAYLRLPVTPREWGEVDDAVAAALGVEVVADEHGKVAGS